MHSTASPVQHASIDPVVSHHMQYAITDPVSPVKSQVCCDHCRAAREGANTLRRLQTGALQLVFALMVIVGAVFRIARLLIAGVLTVLGLVGVSLYMLGQKVVHPDDSRLLPLLPKTEARSDSA